MWCSITPGLPVPRADDCSDILCPLLHHYQALRLIIVFKPEFRAKYARYVTKSSILRTLFAVTLLGILGSFVTAPFKLCRHHVCFRPHCLVFGQYYYLPVVAFMLAVPLGLMVHYMKKWKIADKVSIQRQLKQCAVSTFCLLVPQMILLIELDFGLDDKWADVNTGLGLIMMVFFFLWV